VAVNIVAGVPGAVHDMRLFRDNLGSVEGLIDKQPGESLPRDNITANGLGHFMLQIVLDQSRTGLKFDVSCPLLHIFLEMRSP
jgi:hypothetical protein